MTIQTALDAGALACTNTDMRFEILHDSLVEVTSQGYWLVEIAAARTGLQSYVDSTYSKGNRVELRAIEDITHPDSLKSWLHAPLIIYHKDWISLDNSPEHKRGYVFEAPRVETRDDGEEYLIVKVCVDHPEAVEGLRSRRYVEVSPGYDRHFDGVPGELNGRSYDGKQKNIRINHLALLPPGMARGGRYARVLIDSKEHFLFQTETLTNEGVGQMPSETTILHSVVLDSARTVSLSQDNARVVQDAVNEHKRVVDGLNEQVTTLTSERDNYKGQVETLTDSKKELEAEVTRLNDSKPDFKEVMVVYDQAKPFLGDDFDVSAMESVTTESLKRAAISKRFPEKVLDSHSADSIDGMFSIMIESNPTAPAKNKIGNPPTLGARKIFDAMGKAPEQNKVEDSVDATGKSSYLKQLSQTTEKALGGNA